MNKKVTEIRLKIINKHGKCVIPTMCKTQDFGEILCAHIHGLNMPFKYLARHFNITLNELADLIYNHIRRL